MFWLQLWTLEKFSEPRVSRNDSAKEVETRSSADDDDLRDAFTGQLRSTNTVPFWVRCDFSLCIVTGTTRHNSVATETSLSF